MTPPSANTFRPPRQQPAAKTKSGKKVAPAPYPGAKPSAAKKNPLFEKAPKNFGIGALALFLAPSLSLL